ncbi:hypothetical protein ZWY2020_007366 [Hordeum vulgare]|nr:hypothetical protein ZWY2020_007361 [Hordeum vulgare]KAI4993053.1 hypothetical protein ZWY2020_007366 [Hordeum vulgare]
MASGDHCSERGEIEAATGHSPANVHTTVEDDRHASRVRHLGHQMAIASPGWQAIHKMKLARLVDGVGEEWIFLTVGEAVAACLASNRKMDGALECSTRSVGMLRVIWLVSVLASSV